MFLNEIFLIEIDLFLFYKRIRKLSFLFLSPILTIVIVFNVRVRFLVSDNDVRWPGHVTVDCAFDSRRQMSRATTLL